MTAVVNAAEDRVPVDLTVKDVLVQHESGDQIVDDRLDCSRQAVCFAQADPAVIGTTAKQQLKFGWAPQRMASILAIFIRGSKAGSAVKR
jgi:hypothetical protein